MLISVALVSLTIAVIAAIIIDRHPQLRPSKDPDPRLIGPSATEANTATRLGSAPRRHLQTAFTRLDHRVPAMLLGGAVFLVLVGQVGLLRSPAHLVAYVVWIAGLLMVAGLYWQATWQRPSAGTDELLTPAANPGDVRLRYGLWAVVAVIGLRIWTEVPARSPTDRSWDIVALWLASMALLAVSAIGPKISLNINRAQTLLRHWDRTLVLLLAAGLIATLPRFFDLDRFSWALSGDEGTFAVTARSTLEGDLVNPFSSGPWGYPSLLFIIQGQFIRAFGETVGAARMLSATFGVLSVVAVCALVRHHHGTPPAIAAAFLTATFNLHVYWSRDAQNASAPMFFFPLVLLLLDRGLIERNRRYSLAAGFAIGLAQFFHPANRLLLPIAAAYCGYALLTELLRQRNVPQSRNASFRALADSASWMVAGAIVSSLPLFAYFNADRTAFWSRTNEVSVFASGWLEREQEITGRGAIPILADQFLNALMLPFGTIPHGHFRPGAPLVGWPIVLFVAIGLAVATLMAFRRPWFPFSLAFWTMTLGLALTEGPPMTNRYTAAAPMLTILAALGLMVLATILFELVRIPVVPVLVLSLAVTLGASAWHLDFTFRDDNQVALSSDPNTQLANRLAREIENLGPETLVYLSGAPRIFYGGFATLDYIAPDATGIDVGEPWNVAMPRPALGQPTVFALTPERIGELSVLQDWFPQGTRTDHYLPDGEHLFTSYTVD
jgi:4-amino-4-deoxy-L-arabinose transferase-like glycosyltransferase